MARISYPPKPLGSQATVDLEAAAGLKDLERKPRLSLVPAAMMRGAARALEHGADKYAERGYEHQPDRRRTYLDALLRHAMALADGEEADEDSGLHHLDHMAANIAILLWDLEQ